MSVTCVFGETAIFIVDRKFLGFGDNDLRDIQLMLMQSPNAGAVIANTNGVRKVRFAPKNRGKGKSGSARTVYLHLPEHQRIFLLMAFGKDEKANLAADDKKYCRQLASLIKDDIAREKK